MKLEEFDNRNISSFRTSDDCIYEDVKGEGIYHLSSEYYGDRKDFWIIETDILGKELRRFNVNFVVSIYWL